MAFVAGRVKMRAREGSVTKLNISIATWGAAGGAGRAVREKHAGRALVGAADLFDWPVFPLIAIPAMLRHCRRGCGAASRRRNQTRTNRVNVVLFVGFFRLFRRVSLVHNGLVEG